MPNCRTHWLVAELAAARLDAPPLAAAVSQAPAWLFLGAVAHDALYYLPESSPLAGFKAAADKMHAEGGEDPLLALRPLAEEPPDPRRLAFLAGLVCHLAADAVFHPFIFHHTGRLTTADRRAKAQATQAHYLLETAMDLYFLGGRAGLTRHDLATWLIQAGPNRAEIFALMGRGLVEPSRAADFAQAMVQAFARFAVWQRRFALSLLAWLTRTLGRLLPPESRAKTALAYAPQLRSRLPRLAGPLSYRHPVSGEAIKTCLPSLFHQAVDLALDLCRALEPHLAAGRPIPAEMSAPSPTTGLVLAPARAMAHFAPRPLFLT
jgi:hypothetical protein